MEAYMIERYITTCVHCGKWTIHQAEWINFGRYDKHTYKCGWCNEITTSTWTFAHPSIVGLLLRIDRKPCHPSEFPLGISQYPFPSDAV